MDIKSIHSSKRMGRFNINIKRINNIYKKRNRKKRNKFITFNRQSNNK